MSDLSAIEGSDPTRGLSGWLAGPCQPGRVVTLSVVGLGGRQDHVSQGG